MITNNTNNTNNNKYSEIISANKANFNQTIYECMYCKKTYKLKKKCENHIILCKILHSSQSKKRITISEVTDDDNNDIPSQKVMYKLIVNLALKVDSLEHKIEEMEKYGSINGKKSKIEVLDYLKNRVRNPYYVFSELIHNIEILDSDVELLLKSNFYNLLSEIFSRFDKSEPICCFNQKNHIFYIYDKDCEGNISWYEIQNDQLIRFLNLLFWKIVRKMNEWSKINKTYLINSDGLSIIFDKTIAKLMDINIKSDFTITKIKNIIFAKLKTDI
jgi:hypothetical protein